MNTLITFLKNIELNLWIPSQSVTKIEATTYLLNITATAIIKPKSLQLLKKYR